MIQKGADMELNHCAFSLILFITPLLYGDQQAKEGYSQVVINIDNSSVQAISSEKTANVCAKYFGNKLKECLANCPRKQRKEEFERLSSRAQRNYILSLTLEEHVEFLGIFFDGRTSPISAKDGPLQASIVKQVCMLQQVVNERDKAIKFLKSCSSRGECDYTDYTVVVAVMQKYYQNKKELALKGYENT